MQEVHSPSAHRLIKKLRTPVQVQHWLESLDYNPSDTMYGLEGVIRRGRAHCLEGALSAAALLEQHSYPPLILDLESTDRLDHTLFIFQRNGRWGAVGKSRDIGLDGRRPVFRDIEALAQSYLIPYVDAKAAITSYGVLDLRSLRHDRWRTSSGNVWYVEEALKKLPHHRLRLSPEQTKYWRKKYLTWKSRYPKKQPNYFPGRSTWM